MKTLRLIILTILCFASGFSCFEMSKIPALMGWSQVSFLAFVILFACLVIYSCKSFDEREA